LIELSLFFDFGGVLSVSNLSVIIFVWVGMGCISHAISRCATLLFVVSVSQTHFLFLLEGVAIFFRTCISSIFFIAR